MSSLRLVLARHGETASNLLGLLDSRPPGPPLTDAGLAQALRLADALAGLPVVAVYASVAVRAQQTAAPVAARHRLPVRTVDGVHEVFVGDLEGLAGSPHVGTFVRTLRSWHAGEVEVAMPGGESGRQVLDRFLPVVSRMCADHADGVVVLISHSAAIRLVARTLAGNVSAELADHTLVPNCGTVTLEADDDGWHCVDWAGLAPS